MAKVILITGRVGKERVEEIAREREECEVVTAPVEVASFMTPQMVIESLKGKRADRILVPGLMRGDLRRVEKELGIPAYRGPKDPSHLPYILDHIGEVKLSKTVPACEFLQEELKAAAMQELEIARSDGYRKEKLNEPWNMLVGEVPIGRDFPIRVIAEIVDADERADEEVIAEANYYQSSGAGIIDIGMGKEDPDRVKELVGLLRGLNAPLSIDTIERENITAALENGIDLILSFDRSLISEFKDIKTPGVVIPGDKGVPEDVEERVRSLEENMELARARGFENIIADPILNPVNLGFVDSLSTYKTFGRKHSSPMLMGTGNVTELIDADSVGINGLLCGAAMECGASLVFSPEASDKNRGSVEELATAAKMMYLAKMRGSLPKDLGIDLLRLKEKAVRREVFDKRLLGSAKLIKARRRKDGLKRDSYFKIFVTETITVMHFSDDSLNLIIQGEDAEELSHEIAHLDLVRDLSHALYLGRELEKAEIAFKTGKSYIQDMDVF